MALKVKVVRSHATDSGAFVAVLNHREDTQIVDPILGTVIKTKSDYYYVKTQAQIPLNTEFELDMAKYDVEESDFKNNDKDSVYYGETMSTKWLTPKV